MHNLNNNHNNVYNNILNIINHFKCINCDYLFNLKKLNILNVIYDDNRVKLQCNKCESVFKIEAYISCGDIVILRIHTTDLCIYFEYSEIVRANCFSKYLCMVMANAKRFTMDSIYDCEYESEEEFYDAIKNIKLINDKCKKYLILL